MRPVKNPVVHISSSSDEDDVLCIRELVAKVDALERARSSKSGRWKHIWHSCISKVCEII